MKRNITFAVWPLIAARSLYMPRSPRHVMTLFRAASAVILYRNFILAGAHGH